MSAMKKLKTPARAYPNAQQMKYAAQNVPVRTRSSGDQDMRHSASRMPRIEDGPMAANVRSRFDFRTSECEGRLGKTEGRRSGSAGGSLVAG